MKSSDSSIHYAFTHDNRNNIVKVEDYIQGLTTNRIFNADSCMELEELGTKLQLLYEYDALGRIKKITLPDMSQINYCYNAANLMAVERKNDENDFRCAYEYYLSGKLAKINFSNGLGRIDYEYDSCLRPLRLSSKYWSQVIPEGGYDSSNNLLKVMQTDAAGELTSIYEYDFLNHLVAETGTINHRYQYDSLHNRISKDDILHSINVLNQLIKEGENDYEYDLNGNHSKKKDITEETEYRYDALDRLTAVIRSDRKIEYTYDSFHRRLKKRNLIHQLEGWLEIDTHTYLYLGDKEVGIVDKQGKILELRILGFVSQNDIGATLLMEIDHQRLCPIHDFRGNIAALVDVADGNLLECYRYTAFGEERIFDPNGTAKETTNSPWRFSSKRIDKETGWAFFGKRYYDPNLGKWTTPDPLGFKDGPNVYCYVRNNPMMYIDPNGKYAVPLTSSNLSILSDGVSWVLQNVATNFELLANYTISSSMRAYSDEDYSGIEWPFYEESYRFKVGKRRNDGLGFGFNNGVSNKEADAWRSARMLSSMTGGSEVYGVYNASHGVLDIFECLLGTFGYDTPPVFLTRENWDEHFKVNGGRYFLESPHSQGAIHVRNAANGYDSELLNRIHCMSIAPAAHMRDGLFGSAIHFESKRDFVPLFDAALGGTWNCAPIVKLDPHPDASPWLDHSYDSPTFADPMQIHVNDFFHIYGY